MKRVLEIVIVEAIAYAITALVLVVCIWLTPVQLDELVTGRSLFWLLLLVFGSVNARELHIQRRSE